MHLQGVEGLRVLSRVRAGSSGGSWARGVGRKTQGRSHGELVLGHVSGSEALSVPVQAVAALSLGAMVSGTWSKHWYEFWIGHALGVRMRSKETSDPGRANLVHRNVVLQP